MKYLAKGTRAKIIEDAGEKREQLIQTFQVQIFNDQLKMNGEFYARSSANLKFQILKLHAGKTLIVMHFFTSVSQCFSFAS